MSLKLSFRRSVFFWWIQTGMGFVGGDEGKKKGMGGGQPG